jgi:hypothetical protein
MTNPNELVKVAGAGAPVDGIVFDTPSGPVFVTVNPKALTPRTESGSNDSALRLLLRRTPSPIRGAARGASLGGQSRSGYQRGTAHRPTGR